jgi:hypothetical protein
MYNDQSNRRTVAAKNPLATKNPLANRRIVATRRICALVMAATAGALVQISPTGANQAANQAANHFATQNQANEAAVTADGGVDAQAELPEILPCDTEALAVPPCVIEPPISTDTKPPRPIVVPGDNDHDGIVDATEDALASRFMPWVWFDNGENYSQNCTHPATLQSPGTVLARVRKHPNDFSKIAITYTVLYRKDCGDFFDPGHRGDIEPFTLTLAPNPSCPSGYGAFAIKTVAHQGTPGDTREQAYLGNVCDWGRQAGSDAYTAKIFASENKHGNYLTLSGCDAGGIFGSDHCAYGFTLDFRVFNVGEDWARRIDLMNWTHGFPEEYVWSPVLFCGTLGHRGGHCGAGYIRDKLLNDSLLAPAY